MLKQDISWFDQPKNSVGVLTHKLAVEAFNITKVSMKYTVYACMMKDRMFCVTYR